MGGGNAAVAEEEEEAGAFFFLGGGVSSPRLPSLRSHVTLIVLGGVAAFAIHIGRCTALSACLDGH